MYLSSEYDFEGYGQAEILTKKSATNGDFRRARSMMPFENLDKSGKDFNWTIYGVDISKEKQLANAFIVNFGKFMMYGKGLYIYSKTKGSGKTLLACCLANEVVNRHDLSMKFITVLDYLEMTKKSYKSQQEKEEIDAIKNAGFLILDDIGVEAGKDWVNTTLYQLINYRYNSKLVTVITSNIMIDDLDIDERIKDRINRMCLPLNLPEVSIRAMNTRRENEAFMASILKE